LNPGVEIFKLFGANASAGVDRATHNLRHCTVNGLAAVQKFQALLQNSTMKEAIDNDTN